MNLKGLKYFVAVFETGSISAASKQCFISQPSISTAISNLESQLSTQLFQRHGKGVSATSEGQRLYPLAKRLLNESQAIKSLFSQPQQSTPFRLGLIRSLGVDRMSQLLKDFTQACPDMELTLVEHTDEAEARIITTADLSSQESFLPIWSDTYLLAIPPAMNISLKPKIQLSDLHEQPFIHRMPCEALGSLQQIFDVEGISPQIRARIQTVEYAIGLVAAGLGIAIVPAVTSLTDRQDIVFRPLDDIDLKRTIGLAQPLASANSQHQMILTKLCQHY